MNCWKEEFYTTVVELVGILVEYVVDNGEKESVLSCYGRVQTLRP